MDLGLSCYMSWSLQLYGPGSQLLYVLVSAAIWTWVSAAICLGLCSSMGLGLSCYMSWSLQLYGSLLLYVLVSAAQWVLAAICLGLCSSMILGLSCFISWSLQLYGPGSQLIYILVSPGSQLLYVLGAEAMWTCVSAALCLCLCSYWVSDKKIFIFLKIIFSSFDLVILCTESITTVIKEGHTSQ